MQATIQTMQAQAKEAQERNTDQLKAMQEHSEELQQQIRDLGSKVTQILSLLEAKTAGST